MLASTALVLLMIPGVGYETLDSALRSRSSLLLTFPIQVLLFRPRAAKISSVFDMAVNDVGRCNVLPMVLLGILSVFLTHRRQIHWGSIKHWAPEYARATKCG